MPDSLLSRIRSEWTSHAQPALEAFVRIPNVSPGFDPAWRTNGLMDQAVAHVAAYYRAQLPSAATHVVGGGDSGRTPALLVEIAGEDSAAPTAFLYGHIDKQPPLEAAAWSAGLGPYDPVHRDGRLYGRGAADDGYACFAPAVITRALGTPRGRVLVFLETAEESGSYDFALHLPEVRAAVARGAPVGLVIVLDSEAGDYGRLWVTTALRGVVTIGLRVAVLKQGIHSGRGSGIVPDSFRIARALLDRIEDAATGDMAAYPTAVGLPPAVLEAARRAVDVLGRNIVDEFPWVGGAAAVAPTPDALLAAYLRRSWSGRLAVTGADGLPPVQSGGAVLRPETVLRLSIRVPPDVAPEIASRAMRDVLERDPPPGVLVETADLGVGRGWHAPAFPTWLHEAVECASQHFFRAPHEQLFVGASVPLVPVLQDEWPDAPLLVLGILGPHSNAHGPDEALDLEACVKTLAAVAEIMRGIPGGRNGVGSR